jgi:hypothetical protein
MLCPLTRQNWQSKPAIRVKHFPLIDPQRTVTTILRMQTFLGFESEMLYPYNQEGRHFTTSEVALLVSRVIIIGFSKHHETRLSYAHFSL